MRNKVKITILIATLGLMFLISIGSKNIMNVTQENATYNTEADEEFYPTNPITAKSWWDNFSYIHINGNWSTAANYEWCRGDGSWSNPFIIENITMDASSSPTESGIFIENSKNDYFIIKNCTVYNAPEVPDAAGLKLKNANNGTIIDNHCNDNGGHGILLLGGSGKMCENNTIIENTANNNYNGILLREYCHNNTISGNTANYNTYGGIVLDKSDNNNITGNTANNNNHPGIYLALSDYNLVNNSECNSNGAGIMVSFGNENNITYNTINSNNIGIDISYSDYNSIINNTLIGNTRAIYEYGDCEGNIYEGNTIIPPTGGGGDDDDDDDDDKEAAIPGYDVFLIIGLISVMSIVLLINIEKNKIK